MATDRNQRTFDLDDVQQSLFSDQADRDLLDDLAAQATERDYQATADLLRAACG